MGASYLNKLLTPTSVLGVAWGKTIQTVVGQLPKIAHNPVAAVQLAGYIPLMNPASESRELVRCRCRLLRQHLLLKHSSVP